MYWADHTPPHFHAAYGNAEALFDIATLATLRGALPRRATAMVLEWAALHRAGRMEDWQRCQQRQELRKIAPLD